MFFFFPRLLRSVIKSLVKVQSPVGRDLSIWQSYKTCIDSSRQFTGPQMLQRILFFFYWRRRQFNKNRIYASLCKKKSSDLQSRSTNIPRRLLATRRGIFGLVDTERKRTRTALYIRNIIGIYALEVISRSTGILGQDLGEASCPPPL